MTRAISVAAIIIASTIALLPAQGRRGSAGGAADNNFCRQQSRPTY